MPKARSMNKLNTVVGANPYNCECRLKSVPKIENWEPQKVSQQTDNIIKVTKVAL